MHSQTCTNMHVNTHTHTQSHDIPLTHCSERDLVPLVWRTHFPIPLYFRSANTLSWLWCVKHSTFSLHGQVTCTVVKTTCSVFRVRTQLGHWCSGPPAPEEKLRVKNLQGQTAREWSAWCCVTAAPSPAQRQNSEGKGGSEGIQRRKRQTTRELQSPAGAGTVSVVPSQSCSKAI